MQSQLRTGTRPSAARLNWLPQRSCLSRRFKACIVATSGAVPPPSKDLSKDIVTRQYRRTVYDFALWTKHRDVNRYLYNLKTIPGSRIIRTLGQPMGVVLAWSALFGFYETCLESGVLPSYLPKLTMMSAEPQGLTSFALSLLLVFRTNSSYGRFDEARKIWGGILNRARNIANQAVTFIPAEDVAGREAVGKWTVGFCRALQAHLQEDADLRAELQKAQPRWTPEEIDILCNAQHRPIKAISMLSELTRQLSISQFQALQMQENVTFFYDALGGCERLLRTPIPVSYTRHTARFLIMWLSLLPLGLWERYHWSMLPVIALIGFLLLGIDEIGITIEEPFGILPLDAICTRAQTDVVSLLKDDPAVTKYITDVREGRIKAPAEPPASTAPPPPPAPAAPATPLPVVTATVAAVPGTSPSGPQPSVLQTVASMFSNVKAGIGAVAPGAPRPPSPPPRSRSPRGPFPRASAGTVYAKPVDVTILPATAAASVKGAGSVAIPVEVMAGGGKAMSNGSGKRGAPAPPAFFGSGFTMGGGPSKTDSKPSNAAGPSSSTSGAPSASVAPAAPVKAKAEAQPGALAPEPLAAKVRQESSGAREELSSSSTAKPAAAAAEAPSALSSSASSAASSEVEAEAASNGRSSSRSANWRSELAALRATRMEVAAAAAAGDDDMAMAASTSMDEPTPSRNNSSSMSGGIGLDADEEAMRRFGSLAGRSRSGAASRNGNGANGNGNGHSENGGSSGGGNVEFSRARPRTRPDWRNQL